MSDNRVRTDPISGMSYWGLMKRIRVLDKVLIVFAGRPGFDTKLVIIPLNTRRHYTLSLRHGLDPTMERIPVDIHVTKDGPKKEYVSIGKGTFNMKRIADSITGESMPTIEEIDLEAPDWRNREMVSIDERIMKLLSQKELQIPSMLGEEIIPRPAYEMKGSRLAIGIDTERDIPGMIVKADARSIAIGLPGVKGLEERLEDSLKFESLNLDLIEDELPLEEDKVEAEYEEDESDSES